MNERTDLAKFREELGVSIRKMRDKRIDRNMEEEGEELEKCMKSIVGRTMENLYGTAAIRSIPAELRQAPSQIINCISD